MKTATEAASKQGAPKFLEALAGKAHKAPHVAHAQAGRYLAEYREVRAQAGSFLKLAITQRLRPR